MAFVPSGEQFEIRSGDQRAVVVEVGGGIREYAVAGRDVLEPYALGAMCDGAHGAPLIPWPNRLADGRYSFDGEDLQVSLTEPEKHNAIHGLLRWRPWRAIEREPDRVVVATRLLPMAGYPFGLEVRIEYALGDGGLLVRTTATNVGESAAPYGHGQHPYLSPGTGVIDDCELELGARTRIVVDDERGLPTGIEPVEGTPFDFRASRPLGALRVDYPFTDLARDADGRAWARMRGPDAAVAALWVDASYPILEIFTGDTLGPDRRRHGLGCEPMTCAPNAFQTGEGVIRLEPGESVTTTWGALLT